MYKTKRPISFLLVIIMIFTSGIVVAEENSNKETKNEIIEEDVEDVEKEEVEIKEEDILNNKNENGKEENTNLTLVIQEKTQENKTVKEIVDKVKGIGY